MCYEASRGVSLLATYKQRALLLSVIRRRRSAKRQTTIGSSDGDGHCPRLLIRSMIVYWHTAPCQFGYPAFLEFCVSYGSQSHVKGQYLGIVLHLGHEALVISTNR